MTIRTRFNLSFFLFLSLTSITSLVVVALLNKATPLTGAKALYFCQQLISNTLLKIPDLLPNIIIFTLIPVLTVGMLSFLVQLFKTHSLQKGLYSNRKNLSARLQKLILSLGLKDKVNLVKDPNLFSFCSGIIRGRIIITTSLAESLSNKELEAVLLHEQAHLKNLDPLKIFLGKTVSSMFFFLPIFYELNKNMIATNEILADNWAVKSQKGSNFLRSAIRKILATPQVQLAAVPAITSDSLDIRIHRLVNPTFEHKFQISSISIFTSILFALLSWFILQTPVNAFNTESHEPSYFLCSADNACRQECNHNAQTSTVSSPEELFSPSQTLKYKPSYK